jgi:hypothetical protein
MPRSTEAKTYLTTPPKTTTDREKPRLVCSVEYYPALKTPILINSISSLEPPADEMNTTFACSELPSTANVSFQDLDLVDPISRGMPSMLAYILHLIKYEAGSNDEFVSRQVI